MRKVCAGMPKQRYLLILIGVWLIGGLSAQTGFSLQNELFYSTYGERDGIWQQQVLSMDAVTAGNTRISMRNDLLINGKNRGSHNQGFYDRFRLTGLHMQDNWRLGAGAAATIFGDPDQLSMYPEWQPLALQEKRNHVSAYTSFGKDISRFEIGGHLMLNTLSMDTSEFSFEDFSFQSTGRKSLTDYHGGAVLKAKLGKGLSLLAGLDHQDGDLDAPRLFRMTGTKLGMAHQTRINRQFAIESQLLWQHRESTALPSFKSNVYVSDLRLRMNLCPELIGFVQYTNRSCSDNRLSQLWMISNYLRGQLKYSFYYDESAASYLSLGALYSPENEADAIFADTDIKVYGPWYAGAGINLRTERQRDIHGKLSYHIGSTTELNLQYRYRKNEVDNWRMNYAGLGLSMYY